MSSDTNTKTALERILDPSERADALRELARGNDAEMQNAMRDVPEEGIKALVAVSREQSTALSLHVQGNALEKLVDFAVDRYGDDGAREKLDDHMSAEQIGRLMAFRGDRDSTLHILSNIKSIISAFEQILSDGVSGEPMVHPSIYGTLVTMAEIELKALEEAAPFFSHPDDLSESVEETSEEPEEQPPIYDARGRAFSIETVQRMYEFICKIRDREDFSSILNIQVGEHHAPVLWYAVLGVWANSCPTEPPSNMSKGLLMDLGIEVSEALELADSLHEGDIPSEKGMTLEEYLDSAGLSDAKTSADRVRRTRQARNLL